MEKKLRRLSKTSLDHERRTLRKAVEKAVADYLIRRRGRTFWNPSRQASWTSTRSLRTSRRRWLKWPSPSWGMGSMPARSDS
ncbi:UNVERIFIED_CONTAM: hypothetical protein Sradi_2043300 [Sesamum radiatum]|uniref:Uncharacterized protein n=1 Tax=Sesamum radiatum TaxID=300843 RepID=A0AAW2THK7_SESRA